MIPLLLAVEVDNNNLMIGIVVMALISITTLAINLRDLFIRRPSIDVEFATKDELRRVQETLDQDVTDIRDDITEMERSIGVEASRRAANLHKRMDSMDQQIGHVPSRVVALLKDTKGLL